MRPFLIRTVLPVLFCTLPVLAAAAVLYSIPAAAMEFFLKNIGRMDALILGLGSVLFALQMGLCWKALRLGKSGFDPGADRWITHLAQASEWFPLLGLLGTVAGILQTFSSVGSGPIAPQVIIQRYAPAITATGAGLFMAFVNILPSWMVIFGRDLMLSLGGDPNAGVKSPGGEP